MIPRRIIQTFKSEYMLTPQFADNIRVVRSLHPGFEWLFFSDRACLSFIEEHCSEFLDFYLHLPRTIQRVNLFKILSVYKLGGIYLDVDVALFRPLDALLDGKPFFVPECAMHTDGQSALHLGNFALGSVAHDQTLALILEEMVARCGLLFGRKVTDEDVLFSTGGVAIGAAIARLSSHEAPPLRLLQVEDRLGSDTPDEGNMLPHSVGEFGIHLRAGGWRSTSLDSAHLKFTDQDDLF